MAFFTQILPRRQFRLAPFDLAPLAFEMESDWEEGELLLDRVVTRSADQPGVVALGAPTPGQLHASIERHLRSSERPAAPAAADARDELRDALAELRRSLG